MLYHATYMYYLDNIKKQGLIPNFVDNWEGMSSEQKGVYLTSNKDVAISFIETANVDEDVYNSKGVLLAIDESSLDKSLLHIDQNFAEDEYDKYSKSYVYEGIIKDFEIIEINIEI